jgi:hypothetical protein
LFIGYWLLVIGYWLLVIGYLIAITRMHRAVIGRIETSGWKDTKNTIEAL